MLTRPPAGTIPDSPGSYQFRDRDGRVIYVGKAKSLRSRLSNYFVNPLSLPPRTAQMVAAAESVEWIQVRNDVEALMLEYNFIKQHRPRFNIRLRDDKSYPFLAITLDDTWPRAMVMRGQKRKGTRYFGPYGHARAIRETLDLLRRTFPIRNCSDNKFAHHERLGRPCLEFHIEKCAGPCVGEVDEAEYDRLVDDLIEFLDGDTQPVVRRLERDMKEAASIMEYERAARLRDRLASVRKVIEKQAMVTERPENLDVIGIAEDDLEASVQVFYVRRGRVVGRKGFVVDKVEDVTQPQLVANVLEGMYAEPGVAGVPREVLVPDEPEDAEFYALWLTSQAGRRVTVRVPQRGDKRALLATVVQNANEAFTHHRLKRASDHNARAQALTSLQEALDLPEAPLRIECFDMSHIQGSDYVGSMVVAEDGLPKRSDYRRFKIRESSVQDDLAAMEEVLTRRLTALVQEREGTQPAEKKPRKFAYPPNLLLVDGGQPQLDVAVRVVESLGLDGEISVAALAKRFEEVYVPGRDAPVRIPRQSEALYLLQRVRDEAHRFAVMYHRSLRGKRMVRSALDDVPGLGPVRRKRLVTEMGGMAKLKQAPVEALLALPWLPDPVAQAVHDALHQPALRSGTQPALRSGTQPALRSGTQPPLRSGTQPAPGRV
ncbi:MAG: excinuclease ABC subunit UvrC [Acidimicrobiales bacterium]